MGHLKTPLTPPKEEKRNEHDWVNVDLKKKHKLNEQPNNLLALWQPSYGGAVASAVSILSCPPWEPEPELEQAPSPILQFLINCSRMSGKAFKSELELVITLMSELTLDDKPSPKCEVHVFKGNEKSENSDHSNFEDLILDFENLDNSELDNSAPVQDTATSVPEF